MTGFTLCMTLVALEREEVEANPIERSLASQTMLSDLCTSFYSGSFYSLLCAYRPYIVHAHFASISLRPVSLSQSQEKKVMWRVSLEGAIEESGG